MIKVWIANNLFIISCIVICVFVVVMAMAIFFLRRKSKAEFYSGKLEDSTENLYYSEKTITIVDMIEEQFEERQEKQRSFFAIEDEISFTESTVIIE